MLLFIVCTVKSELVHDKQTDCPDMDGFYTLHFAHIGHH